MTDGTLVRNDGCNFFANKNNLYGSIINKYKYKYKCNYKYEQKL